MSDYHMQSKVHRLSHSHFVMWFKLLLQNGYEQIRGMLIGLKFVKVAALLFIPLVHLLPFGSSLEGKSESH